MSSQGPPVKFSYKTTRSGSNKRSKYLRLMALPKRVTTQKISRLFWRVTKHTSLTPTEGFSSSLLSLSRGLLQSAQHVLIQNYLDGHFWNLWKRDIVQSWACQATKYHVLPACKATAAKKVALDEDLYCTFHEIPINVKPSSSLGVLKLVYGSSIIPLVCLHHNQYEKQTQKVGYLVGNFSPYFLLSISFTELLSLEVSVVVHPDTE